MAVTVKKNPAAWTAVATAGDVTITSVGGYGCHYAITETTTAPTFDYGHRARPDVDVSMTLTGAERLWVKGPDPVFVTAANPV